MAFLIFLKTMIDFYVIRISLWRMKRKLTNAFKAKQAAATRVV
jgi:hypothetical protein